MKSKTTTTSKPLIKVSEVIDDAERGFWAEVIKHFPQATTGDLDPSSVFVWSAANEQVIKDWWLWNASSYYDLELTNGKIIKHEDIFDEEDGNK
tara:strand:+ start:785 stop:1066 length:282 start_codon:yes stop_codon:yes gene_type:complete